MLFTCTHAEDDPERATVPYIAASVAAVSGGSPLVVCTIEGVWTGVAGRPERIEHDGMPPLVDLQRSLLDAGGEIWLCSACTNARGITGDDLIDGAVIVGAARIVEELATGRPSIALG